MSLLDQISKTISQGMDRAKFEAEKFQKTSQLQGEVYNLKKQLDSKLIELGQRAYDLQRAGQINIPSVADMARVIDQVRAEMIGKEEELKAAQAETFEGPPSAPVSPAQSVPIGDDDTSTQEAQSPPPSATAGSKTCPACSFQMPLHAVFCPNCGFRVGN